MKRIHEKLNMIKRILDEDFSYIDIVCLEERQDKGFELVEEKNLSTYSWLMSEYQYMRCGDIIFWLDQEQFRKRQAYLMLYNVKKAEEWICIGEVEPYPLIINKKSGVINCIISDPGEKCKVKEYGQIDEFIDEFVLGKRYLELGTDEEWYEFMETHKII